MQGLRAIAVALVLLFHVWPGVIPGGYVGVDVFFVISGYLITSLLLREVEKTGTISIGQFYARRARRLLPAALTVVGVSFFASVLAFPQVVWQSFLSEFVASAVYVENWLLAAKSVDYLAAEGAVSPVQHYWSLAIEEQYYLLWPLVVLAFTGRGWSARPLMAAVVVVIGCSFAAGVAGGLRGDPSAYFTTHTRVWQLACGALLAVRPPLRAGVGELLLGLGLILYSALSFSGDTSYPGFAAVVPTLGSMLAIAGGRSYLESRTTSWLGSPIATYVGDISYSLYLWHWPVIVIARHVAGDSSGGLVFDVGLVLASLLLAHLSKVYIEDKFRRSGQGTNAVVIVRYAAASLALAGGIFAFGLRGSEPATAELALDDSEYPGAAAVFRNLVLPPAPFKPSLLSAGKDVAAAYKQGCIQGGRGNEVKACAYGNPNASVRVAVVGDSHAVHWLPAFERLAESFDVYVEGLTKTSCSPAGVDVYARTADGPYTACTLWSRNVVDYVSSGDFDHIVISQSPKHRLYDLRDQPPIASAEPLAEALASLWGQVARDTSLYIIRPTPWQPTVVPVCAAENQFPFDGCTGEPSSVFEEDALVKLASLIPAKILDFSDLLCVAGKCPAVIGNVFVYRDAHHLTGTFSRTLAEPLVLRAGWEFDARKEQSAAFNFEGVRPHPADAADDRPLAIADGCIRSARVESIRSCTYGSDSGHLNIAIVGDATGANLVPGLDRIAKKNDWSIKTYFKDSCMFGGSAVYHRLLKAPYTGCVSWSRRVAQALEREPPDVLIFAQSPMYRLPQHKHPSESAKPLAHSLVEELDPLIDAGVKIVAVTGLPWFPVDVPRCALDKGVDGCVYALGEVRMRGPLDFVGGIAPDVATLDLSELFCPGGTCRPVIDGILVYRDSHQPTSTFIESSVERLEHGLYEVGVGARAIVADAPSRSSATGAAN